MSIIKKAKSKVQRWLVKVALKKAMKRGAVALVALITTGKVSVFLSGAGIDVDPVALSASIYAGFEFVRNYVKHNVKALDWI